MTKRAIELTPSWNRKMLGAATFDLPPIVTCPGRSKLCEKYCYSLQGHFHWTVVQEKLKKQLKYFKKYGEIPFIALGFTPKFVRFFASGDLYSAELGQAMGRFARKYSNIPMFFFTRSWRIPELLKEIQKLDKLSNMQVYLSADEETGIPKLGMKVAYMSINDKAPAEKVDVVFRACNRSPSTTARRRKQKPLTYLNGRVCRAQQGFRKITCAQCGQCWRMP